QRYALRDFRDPGRCPPGRAPSPAGAPDQPARRSNRAATVPPRVTAIRRAPAPGDGRPPSGARQRPCGPPVAPAAGPRPRLARRSGIPRRPVPAHQPALAWRQPALAWRQPALAWRQPAPAWRQPALAWRQPALAWRQPALAWRQRPDLAPSDDPPRGSAGRR